MLRLVLLLGFLSLVGCSAAGPAKGGVALTSAAEASLKATETWLDKPGDRNLLKRAVGSVSAARGALGSSPREQAVGSDLELLSGSLNMAQTMLDNGQDPAKPGELSDIPAVESVRTILVRLREDLDRAVATP